MEPDAIEVFGAREHNLQNVDLAVPKKKFVVFTGPSGSGKSSLAIDTIHVEGRRRFVESLSAYARQFLGQRDKPKYDRIRGLSPCIAVEQKAASTNPRSTVGTVTEIADYLRVLFARFGVQSCPSCSRTVERQSAQQIVNTVAQLPEGTRVVLYAPCVLGRKGEHRDVLAKLGTEGVVRARIDGNVVEIADHPALDKKQKHTIEAQVARLTIKAGSVARTADSVESALALGDRRVVLNFLDGNEPDRLLSEDFSCPNCERSFPEPAPANFSPNSPQGMCPTCMGLGIVANTAAKGTKTGATHVPCPECDGTRLRAESRCVRVGGTDLPTLTKWMVRDAALFFDTLGSKLGASDRAAADLLLKEIRGRLRFLENVGLDYLSLDRPAPSLSGGEGQRIQLASQLGSELSGVVYVLDEPSIGLHPRDASRLITTLEALRDLGNTVLVVEHDRETIERADWIVDFGPGAGREGGRVIAQGTPDDIANNPASLTGLYMSGRRSIPMPGSRRPIDPKRLVTVRKARANNLRNIDVSIPLGVLTCITGVSGAGKSTLVNQILLPALQRKLMNESVAVADHDRIDGLHHLDKVIAIDQQPIGRTPRSNPATYVKVFDPIREVFAELPESRAFGFDAARFSFNVKGGRCEGCEGSGLKKIEMHFLADVFVTCEECGGERFNDATLRVQYRGKTIADVLAMTVREALELFGAHPHVARLLRALDDVGLGYMPLGQPSPTLSGGEAQRVKLARELSRPALGRTLYVLDEPSTGLHFEDIRKLLEVLDRLVVNGHTVVVIEHNLDIIKVADWIVDIGPEGGSAGGLLVAEGTPEHVATVEASYTGVALRAELARSTARNARNSAG